MSYDRLREPGFDKPAPTLNWYIHGCMVPIYTPDGDLIKCVGLCWEAANTEGYTYEIADVQYGSIDGIILPEIEDIHQAVREKMGLNATLIFPDKLTHNPKL